MKEQQPIIPTNFIDYVSKIYLDSFTKTRDNGINVFLLLQQIPTINVFRGILFLLKFCSLLFY